MTSFARLATPVGSIGVAVEGEKVTRVTWDSVAVSVGGPDPLLTEALAQLAAYFEGRLGSFDLPIDLGMQTDATSAVLTTLRDGVPLGETLTYGGLARRSGTTVPARGIGAIMGANPVPILVPCHRVVAEDGLGGYSGGAPGQGLQTKRWLLEHERALPATLF